MLTRYQAELLALHDTSADSTKILTEKLALSRELSALKPELEHLRTQASTNEGILAEKLALQGQLDAARTELDNEKRSLKRALSKQGATSQQDAEREEEISQLQAELAKEKRERQKAEKVLVKANEDEIEAVRKELAKEKKMREAAEGRADGATAVSKIKDLRKELAKEKEENERLEKEVEEQKTALTQLEKRLDEQGSTASADKESAKEVERLKKELAKLRSEHEKETKASSTAVDSQVEELKRELAQEKNEREALDEKLTLFREKLRTTKEKLKHSEAELLKAQQAQVASPHLAASIAIKNPRKRPAVAFDPDAAIGTPGDAAPAKRSKRASSVVVEKSTFSITPFLNRTTSVALDDAPKDDDEDQDQDRPIASIEAASPTAAKSKTKRSTSAPLAPISTNKSLTKPATTTNRKKAIIPSTSLDTVTEEPSKQATTTTTEAPQRTTSATTKPKPTLKPRKSLASFASFRDGSLPPQPLVVQNKKKRKLLGSTFGAKTIFDEDEEDDNNGRLPSIAGARVVSAGGQRAFGTMGGAGGGGGFGKLAGNGGWGGFKAGKAKGPLMVTGDGFVFSPLKKDRKALAAKIAAGGA